MYLKKITLNGFKSFSKKTELTFNVPITCIVGPNGSGKSNVAEAFKWVLGEQSIKSLRGKRGEDLIFNGTRNTPRLNRASVSVYFTNKDNVFNIDFDEACVTREVFRDGSNKYLLNGTHVRLKDIIELLSNVSLGVSSHHIINQGEADKILVASLKERRAIIEDALGLRIYHWKVREAERKLEKTDINLKEVESLKKEISGHIRFLKKEVEKIEKSETLRNSLLNMYEEYFSIEKSYLNHIEEETSKQKGDLESRLKDIDETIMKIENNKKIVINEENNADIYKLESDLKILRNKKDDITRKLGRVEGMIEIGRDIILKEDSLDSSISINDIREWSDTLLLSINEAEKSNDIIRIKEVLFYIKRKIKNFFDDIRINEKNNTNNDERIKLEEDKKILESEIKKIIENESNIAKELGSIKEYIAKIGKEEREEERNLFEKREERGKLLGQIEAILVRYEKLNHEKEDFKRELQEAGILLGLREEDIKNNSFNSDYLNRKEQEERRREIHKNKVRLEDVGPINESIIKEYKEVSDRDLFLEREIGDLNKTKTSLESLIEELLNNLDKKFEDGMDKINKEFTKFFKLMFDGGDASIRVFNEKKKKQNNIDLSTDIDISETFEEEDNSGIEIRVNLPRKRIKSLEMLSGGERALTSIALLFAMSQVSPPPFLILDETDAALDEANSKKYGDMIENLSKHSQLILVTHNRETMSRADVLYGVTMGGDGISKLLSVKFEEAVNIAK